MGHKDKTKDEASLMREKEEEAIELYRLIWRSTWNMRDGV
jgi:hypothetical protein